MIEFEDFQKADLRVGTIVHAEPHARARKPAYILEVDFGDLGRKTSSAQLTDNYRADELMGMQVVAVVNFPPRQVAHIRSEVLVLGALSDAEGTVLLKPERPVENGARIA